MKKTLGRVFSAALSLNATLTRSAAGRPIEARFLTPFFVRLTRAIRGRAAAPVAGTPEALGREWERLLGDRRYARVTEIDAASQTVYGEISGLCPLRGSGDLAACYRLMAYDRGLLAPHKARLVVLASQAEPGRSTCRIAIRPELLPASDLLPAHLRPQSQSSSDAARPSCS
jgi:hypothetical protein